MSVVLIVLSLEVWDVRKRKSVLVVKENTDFISDMCGVMERSVLLCSR